MSRNEQTWQQGLNILKSRQKTTVDAVCNALSLPLDLSRIDLRKFRRIVATGIGSSSAHARYLAWLLQTQCALPAEHVSTGVFLKTPAEEAREQALIVFSQGLSPNARVPLSQAKHFGEVILITAAGAEQGERAAALRKFEEDGVIVIPIPTTPEYEVLLRIVGPLVGFAIALRIAIHYGASVPVDTNDIASAMRAAEKQAEDVIAKAGPRFENPITFITTDGYETQTSNLCAKVVEGMFLPPPVAVDALEFAHGFMQEAAGKERTFIALARGGSDEAGLFSRVRATLEPQHAWLELTARLPGALSIFEHEAAMNAIVLRAIAERHLDQKGWPGKGRDAVLYSVASAQELHTGRLSDLTWPEVETRLHSGNRTVIIPLGAIEQHGPHLPLVTDSLIAEELAGRLCSRIPGAVHAPTVQLGCSVEHMAFTGTLSLQPETLRMVLTDMVSSLVHHGFDRILIFSAHGGNFALLKDFEPQLTKCAAPAKLIVVHGVGEIGDVFTSASAAEGVSAEDSGLHAGEYETSIVEALRPDLVRRQLMERGLTEIPEDSQSLFYPSLRNHSESGVVGDPRPASSNRAERYLSAWVDYLFAAYRKAVDSPN